MASESIMKLFLAAYYLRLYGAQSATPQAVKDRLAYMLMYSDYADPWVMPTSPRIALPGKGSGLVRSA